MFTLFTSQDAGLQDEGIAGVRTSSDFSRKESLSPGFIQSSAVRWSSYVAEQIEHEILNSRDLSKKGSAAASVGLRRADREEGDRSVRAIKKPSLWRTRDESRAKTDACIIRGRKVQPTENWLRCHLSGGFASFHWRCFGEYLRADSERQVESVVWKASSNPNAERADS